MSGMRLPEIQDKFEIGRATAQRDMKVLKDIDLIEFIGSPKSGKYFISETLKKIIEKGKS